MGKYTKVLKDKFHYDKFRLKQLDIIRAILEEKRDICAIMFTGAGKSLCYQFPSVYTQKVAVVISPLISLANDQLMKMDDLNIPACCLNSTVSYKDKLLKDIINNKYRLVYTTPEYLVSHIDFVIELSNKKLLTMIAVDEAHCISSWGHDFREAYKKLDIFKKIIPHIPILALTATATDTVRKDIVSMLKLDDPVLIKTTFNRPNLLIKVIPKNNMIYDLKPIVKKKESTLIYCQTRKLTDELSNLLKTYGVSCGSYHAGMESYEREIIHTEFSEGKIDCVVATIAFGMGIDISIRNVVHYGIPKDMESYYQEIGRAGRDGKQSNCYLFYALTDMNNTNYFINQITDISYRNRMMKLTLVMKNYVFSSQCRRRYILDYFGEKYTKDNCKMCDICLDNVKRYKHNLTREGKMMFYVIYSTGECYGSTMLINILRGSRSSKITFQMRKLKYYGAGGYYSDTTWKNIFRLFINHGYVNEKAIAGGRGSQLQLTKKAFEWIKENKNDPDDVIVLEVPKNIYHMLNGIIPKTDIQTPSSVLKKSKLITGKTYHRTYQLYEKGYTLKKIAQEQELQVKTIEDHINKLYKMDYDIDLEPLGFTDQVYKLIFDKIVELNFPDHLKVIKDELPRKITYLHIKLTITRMEKEKKKSPKKVSPKKGSPKKGSPQKGLPKKELPKKELPKKITDKKNYSDTSSDPEDIDNEAYYFIDSDD